LDGVRTAPERFYSIIAAGVPLQQMPVVVNIPATRCGATPAPAKPIVDILITKAETTMDTKMDNMMLAFES
jgi:hypothetical protein